MKIKDKARLKKIIIDSDFNSTKYQDQCFLLFMDTGKWIIGNTDRYLRGYFNDVYIITMRQLTQTIWYDYDVDERKGGKKFIKALTEYLNDIERRTIK